MPAVHRVGDSTTGHPCPPGGGGSAPPTASAAGSGSVFADGKAIVRAGDPIIPHPCTDSPPHGGSYVQGCTVYADGLPIQHIGSAIDCTDKAASGSSTVFVEEG